MLFVYKILVTDGGSHSLCAWFFFFFGEMLLSQCGIGLLDIRVWREYPELSSTMDHLTTWRWGKRSFRQNIMCRGPQTSPPLSSHVDTAMN